MAGDFIPLKGGGGYVRTVDRIAVAQFEPKLTKIHERITERRRQRSRCGSTRLVVSYLEARLSNVAHGRFNRHLSRCALCREAIAEAMS